MLRRHPVTLILPYRIQFTLQPIRLRLYRRSFPGGGMAGGFPQQVELRFQPLLPLPLLPQPLGVLLLPLQDLLLTIQLFPFPIQMSLCLVPARRRRVLIAQGVQQVHLLLLSLYLLSLNVFPPLLPLQLPIPRRLPVLVLVQRPQLVQLPPALCLRLQLCLVLLHSHHLLTQPPLVCNLLVPIGSKQPAGLGNRLRFGTRRGRPAPVLRTYRLRWWGRRAIRWRRAVHNLRTRRRPQG